MKTKGCEEIFVLSECFNKEHKHSAFHVWNLNVFFPHAVTSFLLTNPLQVTYLTIISLELP